MASGNATANVTGASSTQNSATSYNYQDGYDLLGAHRELVKTEFQIKCGSSEVEFGKHIHRQRVKLEKLYLDKAAVEAEMYLEQTRCDHIKEDTKKLVKKKWEKAALKEGLKMREDHEDAKAVLNALDDIGGRRRQRVIVKAAKRKRRVARRLEDSDFDSD